eukprot:gnl/Dysnectes_brevis/2436_a2899_883.p1 GENE.gnl/Dysnectes_brevis/2436_a2899_883~~gnl/Dysnectes_brevis/2436_a2899_883.p1  ORF type:complete len:359 (-),score=104.53 gnl/Dysnectes_brevis/2436_a2899_883:239-1228(-)
MLIQILERLEIDEAFLPMFGLFETIAHGERLLKPTTCISEMLTEGKETQFLFRVIIFYTDHPEPLALPENLRRVVYTQALDNIRSGYWHVSPALGHQLAATAMCVELGPHAKRPKAGFILLHLDQYLPPYLRQKPKKAEKLVLAAHSLVSKRTVTSDPTTGICHYLSLLQLHAHQYGMHIFSATHRSPTDSKGQHVFIGVNRKGVHLLDHPSQAKSVFHEMKNVTGIEVTNAGAKSALLLTMHGEQQGEAGDVVHRFDVDHHVVAEEILKSVDVHRSRKLPVIESEEEDPAPRTVGEEAAEEMAESLDDALEQETLPGGDTEDVEDADL